MSGKVRIRGARRKRQPEGSADWEGIAALMHLSTMTPEERIDFIWSHPELEEVSMAPARTDAERRWLPKAYLEWEPL